MRIAILTQPLGKNYGGILQAYALQQVLKSMGHETTIINRVDNYPSTKLLMWRLASFVKCLISKYFKHNHYVRLISPFSLEYITDTRLVYDYSQLKKFIFEHIVLTKELRSSNRLRRYLLKNKFDLVVVGSDQVWREEYSPCISDYFGGFADTHDKLSFLSYAASFGQDTLPISEKKSSICGDLLRRFVAVSVRERSAVNILKKTWNIDSRLVLDPTLLLGRECYEGLIGGIYKGSLNGIFCYILDQAIEKKQIIRKVSKTLGKDVNQILLYPKNKRGDAGQLSSIEHWLYTISTSQFVVTDSYHGCVFSIIFNKPFIVIANRNRGIDRFTTLLDLVNLTHRMIYSVDELTDQLIKDVIDYDEVNTIICRNRLASLNFLKDALTK